MVRLLAAVLVIGLASPAWAQPAKPKPAQADTEALAKTLRELLLKHIPDPLVESAPTWGQQRECVVGFKFQKDGLKLRTEPIKGLRNDGLWQKFSVKAANPDKTLALGIKDAEYPEPGRVTFTAMLATDCDFKLESQVWKTGARLYSGETRGRCVGALVLKCEATTKTETKPGSFVPEVTIRVRATEAELFYDKIVVEHTAGLGGDAARVIGDVVIAVVRRVKPDLERNLLTKANAAIVKAADTKEVRLSVDKLLKAK